jgi:hypothetical protein
MSTISTHEQGHSSKTHCITFIVRLPVRMELDLSQAQTAVSEVEKAVLIPLNPIEGDCVLHVRSRKLRLWAVTRR